MWSRLRSVMALRGSLSGDAARGRHGRSRGSSRDSVPWSTNIPIRVTAMLLAVLQVRVRVWRSTPGA